MKRNPTETERRLIDDLYLACERLARYYLDSGVAGLQADERAWRKAKDGILYALERARSGLKLASVTPQDTYPLLPRVQR